MFPTGWWVTLFSAAAQAATLPALAATLQGVVRDDRGTVLAGVTVELQSVDMRQIRTDAKGFYRFSSLTAGSYTIHVKVPAFSERTQGPIKLAKYETKNVDFVLTAQTASLELFDEPKFTVAGVTDHTYVGGHGSDTIVRSAEDLTKATEALSKDTPTPINSAGSHHAAAEADEKLGKSLEAVREYQQAAELDPSETNLFDWGTELLVHKAPDAAIEVFRQGMQRFPSSSRLAIGAAVAFYVKGDYAEAAKKFFAATDLRPDDPQPYLFLGKIGSPEITGSTEFLNRLARFVKLHPENAWANYYYAAALWRSHESHDDKTTARVKSLLEKATEADPKLAAGYLQLGVLYAEQSNFVKAIAEFQIVIRLEPRTEQAHYRLAQAYRQVGDLEKSRKETDIFQDLSKTAAQDLQRQRSELQQFVVSLKTSPSN